MIASRRGFLVQAAGFVACAPAIVRVSNLMPVKPWRGELNEAALALYRYRMGTIIALGYAITVREIQDNLAGSTPQWSDVFAALSATRAA